jgi:hypothetical protein
MEASTDARKVCLNFRSTRVTALRYGQATELDPNYAKAWARLATAKHVSKLSIHAMFHKQICIFRLFNYGLTVLKLGGQLLRVSLPLISSPMRTNGSVFNLVKVCKRPKQPSLKPKILKGGCFQMSPLQCRGSKVGKASTGEEGVKRKFPDE